MKNFIINKLHEDISTYQTQDKYGMLEQDLTNLVQKHMKAFEHYPNDTYGVLEAIEQVFEGMFQKVNR